MPCSIVIYNSHRHWQEHGHWHLSVAQAGHGGNVRLVPLPSPACTIKAWPVNHPECKPECRSTLLPFFPRYPNRSTRPQTTHDFSFSRPEPCHPTVSLNLQASEPSWNDTATVSPSSLQAPSQRSTATSHFFRILSRCTLDLTRSTSISSTISLRSDGRAINCHKRRKTWTSPLYTALRRSSFHPFSGMDLISKMFSNFSFTSQLLF